MFSFQKKNVKKNSIKILNLIKNLFPIHRSLTGKGNVKTLLKIKKIIPKLRIIKYPSGKKVFDWTIPSEWNVKDAYILDPSGKKICDFKKNNLHLVGYSQAINKTINLKQLKKNLFYLKDNINAIPYITSYYDKTWGFCISKKHFKKLKKGKYRVFINSTHNKNGNLVCGELLKKGKVKKEILFSTNICHPSMANNELSGPTILTYLAKEILKKKTHYSYRFIFVPETIGCLAYLKKEIKKIKSRFVAGYHLTCIGYGKNMSIIEAKNKNSYTNIVSKKILFEHDKNYKNYSFLDRGSDERQFNSPGIDLSVATIMREKFGSYKEYHTSKDNMNLIKRNEIENSYSFFLKLIEFIENDFLIKSIKKDFYIKSKVIGEPFFRKRNMYRKFGTKNLLSLKEQDLFNIMAYATNIKISDLCVLLRREPSKLLPIISILKEKKLIELKR